MRRQIVLSLVIGSMVLLVPPLGLADVPAPPVNQEIGFLDVSVGDLQEADCRVCHASGVPNRHHLLYGKPIPDGSIVPYPDTDGDGNDDPDYVCLSCHGPNFVVERDCVVCHTTSPHHTTPEAQARHCKTCHGSVVDNYDDGHYIPTYAPSLVTPTRSQGDGLPLNSRGKGAGACNYCHDNDGLPIPIILTNMELHHGTGLAVGSNCGWCHGFALPFEQQIRVCEDCHGPNSLHNIQADSNGGGVVVGGEDAGYGHVGRDAGPGDSDCWGCHGFAMASAPGSGPIIPTISGTDRSVVDTGADTAVVLTGSGFTNRFGDVLFESAVTLTAADGSSVALPPDALAGDTLTVTIPARTAPGNYDLRAVKSDQASNPAAISIVPQVSITAASCNRKGIVTLAGAGFAGHAAGSGTAVTGTLTVRKGRKRTTTKTAVGRIISWNDQAIRAKFSLCPADVTVHSVFGSDTLKVGASKLSASGASKGLSK